MTNKVMGRPANQPCGPSVTILKVEPLNDSVSRTYYAIT